MWQLLVALSLLGELLIWSSAAGSRRSPPPLYAQAANVLEFPFQTLQRGAVAQLEEYLNGIQGVVGSNPISSTNPILIHPGYFGRIP